MTKILHTGIYSEKGKHIITQMRKMMHSGYYHVSKADKRAASSEYAEIACEPDGEIVFRTICGSYPWNQPSYFKCDSLEKQYDWLAWRLKLCIFKELETSVDHDYAHKGWKRDNTTASIWLSTADTTITISDVYCLYDILKNRKNIERKYKIEQIDELKGVQRDPFLTQLEVNRREEAKRINDEYAAKIRSLENESYTKSNEAADAVRKEYRKRIEESKAELKQKLAELDEMINATVAAA